MLTSLTVHDSITLHSSSSHCVQDKFNTGSVNLNSKFIGLFKLVKNLATYSAGGGKEESCSLISHFTQSAISCLSELASGILN